MNFLEQQLGSASASVGEIPHKEEPDGLYELALFAETNEINDRQKKLLAENNLLPDRYNKKDGENSSPSNVQFYSSPKQQKNTQPALGDLEARLIYYQEKLSIAESIMSDSQYEEYQKKWHALVIEAAGAHLETAAGIGFLEIKRKKEHDLEEELNQLKKEKLESEKE